MSEQTMSQKFDSARKSYAGKAIGILFFIYIIIMIAYFVSQGYRVGSTISTISKYEKFLLINDSYLSENKRQDMKLKNFYVTSAYRPYMASNQKYDYASEKILEKNIESGCRFILLDIFNETLSEDTEPVVSTGIEKGNWKYTLNTVYFNKICQIISERAFTSGYVNNYNDPFFIALNLKTNNNHNTLNRVQEAIFKYLKPKLLPSKFANQSTFIGDALISELMGKVIILSSGGYEHTNLEEIINYSWDKDDCTLMSYKTMDVEAPKDTIIKNNPDDVRNFNKTGISIVIPDENSFFTNNYDPDIFFDTGCQFICMNYQKSDDFMSKYITKFRYSSFLEKPDHLKSGE
tara:strand:+ start:16844 stop:17887 length:1044 start_codon:yes stop_codon:yes gene_type:complete